MPQMLENQKQTLTPDDIAEVLHLHYDTVVRMLRRGAIPGRKIGRVWRTDATLFQAWLQQGEPKLLGHPLIVSDPNIMLGKPVIAGTRITVEHIMREITAGTSVEEVLQDHPALTREQIQAAIDYGVAASGRAASPFDQASA